LHQASFNTVGSLIHPLPLFNVSRVQQFHLSLSP
jgi:hypothetical protein